MRNKTRKFLWKILQNLYDDYHSLYDIKNEILTELKKNPIKFKREYNLYKIK